MKFPHHPIIGALSFSCASTSHFQLNTAYSGNILNFSYIILILGKQTIGAANYFQNGNFGAYLIYPICGIPGANELL